MSEAWLRPLTNMERIVSVRDVVDNDYEAWTSGTGDFSAVPVAPGFTFTGPVVSNTDHEPRRSSGV